MTLIGISSISTTSFENIISGNERVASAAFYAAEAGVQVGFDQLPPPHPIPPIPVTLLGNESYYWSGGPEDKGAPTPIMALGTYPQPGYASTWEFKWFQINATGESFAAVKEIEIQARYGPIKASTTYNN